MELKFFRYCLIALALLLAQVPRAVAINTGELADIIDQMESSIVDISIEYELHIIPTPTPEEGSREAGFKVLSAKDGFEKLKFSAANLLPDSDPNSLDWQAPGKFLQDLSCTIINGEGNSWMFVTKQSYNGQIGKSLNINDLPDKETKVGSILAERPPVFVNSTLLGFSIFRLAYIAEQIPFSDRLLSSRLRAKDKVQLDNVVKKIDGFNTIRADLLTDFLYEGNRLVYMRVYFSVDHGYTPVRFEHMNGRKVVLTVSVESLEEVAKGVWFPRSGINYDDSGLINALQAIGPILVNQGRTDEHFDIDFPVGTKVYDEIQGREYVVKQE